MKKTQLKFFGLMLLGIMLIVTACGGAGSDEMVKVGITQIIEHPSLDAAREGFKQAFIDGGYVEGETISFDEQNAQGDQSTASSIAGKFASDGVDLILAIATPTAQATAQAVSDIPIFITAVTEPVLAGLADSWERPGGNVTGTSDLNPVADQLRLLTEIAPDAKTVGIVYNSGEVNSEVQVDIAREVAEELGLELRLATVTGAGEVLQAAESLSGVDAFYVPTDNTVVEGLEAMIQVAESRKIPLIVGEGDSVERGGLATWGIDYRDLGYQTGLMALKVLQEDADPADMAIETLDDIKLIVNLDAAARMGIDIPQDILDRADSIIE